MNVPNVVTFSWSDADAVATGLGLDLDSTGSEGVVVDQWPAAGETVDQRSTVHVTLDKTK